MTVLTLCLSPPPRTFSDMFSGLNSGCSRPSTQWCEATIIELPCGGFQMPLFPLIPCTLFSWVVSNYSCFLSGHLLCPSGAKRLKIWDPSLLRLPSFGLEFGDHMQEESWNPRKGMGLGERGVFPWSRVVSLCLRLCDCKPCLTPNKMLWCTHSAVIGLGGQRSLGPQLPHPVRPRVPGPQSRPLPGSRPE